MSGLHEVRRAAARVDSCLPALLVAGLLLAVGGLSMHAQVSVTTWRNDIGRTGQNLNETILTPSNVNPTQFGKLFSQAVDGYVYAEPLYLPNVTIGGQSHNVVFVATEHDSVYAFDADSNGGANSNPLWFASMLTPAHGAAAGATTPSSNTIGTDIIPELGITGTPVIDPATGTLYVVSFTQEGSSFFLRLHALDITSGAEKLGGPVVISASVPGTGNGSTGGTLALDPEWANQRSGLLLLNGIIYIAFGSHGDNGPWHGWLLGYNEQTLKQTGVFCTSPSGVGGGIWMGGAGLAADVLDPVNHPYGRVFLATGNGDYTATTPYSAGMDYGDSILDLDLTNGVPTIQDEFTPAGQAQLDEWDMDQASGGLMIVPTQTTGSNPNLLVQTGKSGIAYLLNRQNLGGYNTAGDQVVQELTNAVGNTGAWTTPAYWNGTVYYWGQIDTLKTFPLVNGLLTGPSATSSEKYGYPGANPVISANGNTQGIVWSLETDGYMDSKPSVLMAHDATNISTTLYSSATNSSRDNPGNAVKFTVPTVVNGKVYVGAQYQLSVYGLLTGQQSAADPVLSPGAETFPGNLSVSITEATPGATIYYTLDGSTPTVASPVYTAPIALTATTTIQAIASAPGFLQSGVTSQTYIDSLQVNTPVFTPGSSTSTQSISVTITDSTAGATIYYTTDGTTPTTSSTQYSGAVTVNATETLSAIAVATGFANSDVASASYTINTGQTGIDFPQGFAGTQGIMILNGSTDLDDSRLQLTTGLPGEAGSAWYYQPVNIQAFTSNFSFQLSNPAGEGITFAIQGDSNTALGSAGSGLGYQGIANSIAIKFDLDNAAGEGPDSIGLYTNGASPTVPAIDLSTTGIDLHSDDTFIANVTYNGTILSMTITDMITGAAYSTSWPINIPSIVGGDTAYVGFTGGTSGLTSSQKVETWVYTTVSNALPVTTSPIFNPPGGSYSTSQSVTITSGSSGATIYYTTNGTTPTTASTVYSGPIVVSATETLQAIAVASGYGPSAVGTAAYSIAPTLPAPVLTPGPGTFTTSQTVTITDAASGTTIYYTTDGTTPTASSSVYSSAIVVGASETLQAIAAETGYNNSPVSGGTYTIAAQLPAPTFSLAAGTYSSSQTVTISESTSGATIYYTTNGATPTTSSTVYAGPITVSATETLQAIAVETGYTNSAVTSAVYTISTPGITYINYPSSGFTAGGLSLNNGANVTGGVLQITDGGVGEDRSAWFATEVPVQSFIANFTFQQSNASADGMTFAIQGDNIWSLGDPGGGLGYEGISNSVAIKFDLYNNAGEGADSTGLYTGGAIPTLPSVDLSSTAINLHSGDIMNAQVVYDGTNLTMTLTDTVTKGAVTEVFPVNIPSMVGGSTAYVGFTGATGGLTATQNVLSWTYVSPAGNVAAAPTFSPAAGTYSTSQQVTISDSTSGTTIYYTTNGTTPTASSTVYSGPITVSSTETLEAIAVESGYTNSAVSTATYTIAPALPVPAFSPAAGSYTAAQSVTISDTTAGTTIYYTTNGTTPTTSSNAYSGPITVSATETIEAIAVETGFTNSAVATAAYTITPTLPAPAFSPAAGAYTTSQSVTISDSTSGTTIYYTTNGTTPTTSSAKYTGAITVSSTETVEAIAIETGFNNSTVSTAAYTITPTLPAPTFSPAAGTYSTSQSVTISDATSGTTIYYTTNGTTPTTSSSVYGGPITVSATETLEAIAVQTGFTNSAAATAAYTITPVLPAPTFSPVAGTYTASQSVTISDSTSGTTIYYTTNGATPTTSSTKYTKAITVSATETLEAIAVKTGFTNSAVATAAYTITPVLPAPAFSPAAGAYSTPQSVTIGDATSGTTIYYTTNGTTPTTSSTKYTGAVTVSATETLEAIAVETGFINSAVATAAYTITPTLPAPAFSPAAGGYSTSQSVAISDATSGATIYYTTNGTAPTTSSSVYSGPITVSTTETLEAIAVETGFANSAVSTATYTIGAVTSYINYPSGGFTAASLSLNNGPAVTGGLLQVTDGGVGEVRSAWFATEVPVQSFTTNFTFQLLNASADGMTFAIQRNNIWSLGDPGGGLGYQGIANSVAVKFDLYNNSGEGSDSTGLYTGGAIPTVPSVDLSSTPINLHSGDIMNAQLVYDGTNLTMTLTDTVTNGSVTEVFPVNIPSLVGGNTAYVGFTGATGGLTATQNVLSWTYSAP
ncbi:MAG: chitobiase/beta-hexosaminidase C-terminal domain-containing protein [Terracidiphilus sp.]|jgi:LysM repeat protein